MPGAANVTFYHHSGFSVEVKDTLMIFDYWRGENNALPRGAWIENEELEKFSQILVFVSHDHEDHFDEIIYSWDYSRLPITYIVSDDLPIGKRGKRIKPGDTLLILGKSETGLIVTKPETLNDLASQIFQTVENED